jgi:hypothetical protein
VLEALTGLKMEYPETTAAQHAELESVRKVLANESSTHESPTKEKKA